MEWLPLIGTLCCLAWALYEEYDKLWWKAEYDKLWKSYEGLARNFKSSRTNFTLVNDDGTARYFRIREVHAFSGRGEEQADGQI